MRKTTKDKYTRKCQISSLRGFNVNWNTGVTSNLNDDLEFQKKKNKNKRNPTEKEEGDNMESTLKEK